MWQIFENLKFCHKFVLWLIKALKMNTIKIIRDQFGLSQQYLAVLLGVKRTLLSMAETNKRELPTAASIKLNEMFLSIGITEFETKEKSNMVLPDNPQKFIEKFQEKLLQKADLLEALAKQMEINYEIAQRRQQYLPNLFQDPTPAQKTLLEILEMENQQLLSSSHPKNQNWCREMSAYLKGMPEQITNSGI